MTLRPDPIPELQRTLFATLEAQLIASVLLLIGLFAAVRTIRAAGPRLRKRHGSAMSEVIQTTSIFALVVTTTYALSVVWHFTYVVHLVLEAAFVGRGTALLQLVTVAVFVLAYLLVRLVNRSIDTLAETSAITKHQSEVAYHVADVGIFAAAFTIVLTIWGVDLTNIFIGAGAISAVVGLAARETLSAMIAGFVLLFARPFRVGDWIEVNDRSGVVKDVTVFNTKIQTFSDEHVLVPNDEITSSQLTNYSRNDQLRVDVEVGVDYETNLEHARTVLVEAGEEVDIFKSNPSPQVVTKSFGDSAILLELRGWIGAPTRRRELGAKTGAIRAIKAAFDREGIDIPYPQRVHDVREDVGVTVDSEASSMQLTEGDD